MSEKIRIISDGSCDLPKSLIEERDITVVPFYVSFDSVTYQKEGEELDVREFYQKMVDNPSVFPKTSMPSVDDYVRVFEPLARDGIAAVCICITVKFSGSLQSAMTARDMVLEEYPDARIAVIDSTMDTVLQGLYVLEAARLRDQGWDFDRLVAAMLDIRESGRIFFTIGNIDYLKHGGRIGKLAGIAGSALKIKPLITLKTGEIHNSGIARNRERSMSKVIDLLSEYIEEIKAIPGAYSFAIGYGFDYEEALRFRDKMKDMVKEKLGIDKIGIYQIGAAISVHTGPYPLGVGILRKPC
jgi:DegV family protein with EDD domain